MIDDNMADAEEEKNEHPVPETAVEAEVKEAAAIEIDPAAEDKPAAESAPEDEAQAAEKSERMEKLNKREARRRAAEMTLVVSWFAACGRCSFFLAGYKVAGGEAALATAVANRGKHWLTLPWSQAIANLIHKSYGSRVDIDCYHYEGCCSECQRHFVYQAAEGDVELPNLRIELKTRQRQ